MEWGGKSEAKAEEFVLRRPKDTLSIESKEKK